MEGILSSSPIGNVREDCLWRMWAVFGSSHSPAANIIERQMIKRQNGMERDKEEAFNENMMMMMILPPAIIRRHVPKTINTSNLCLWTIEREKEFLIFSKCFSNSPASRPTVHLDAHNPVFSPFFDPKRWISYGTIIGGSQNIPVLLERAKGMKRNK